MWKPLSLLQLILLTTMGVASGRMVDVPELGLRIAAGFEITRFADHGLAPDVYSMTLDPEGQVVISSRGYIKRLLDSDGDGRADGEVLIREGGPGAMGMCFIEGGDLLTAEGGRLNRYSDDDGDGQLDPEPALVEQFAGGEHGLHAIRRGPDGMIYVIGGNDAKITSAHANLPTSPVRRPEGGALLRFTPDLRGSEIISHGFRNPYDFDFGIDGKIYVYDSDCESEYPLPWYSPTRLYRAELGAHHGWRLRGYKRGHKRPDYYFDSVRPLVNVGRGSPTGVAVCRNTALPEPYQGGVFYCDWTFGKIYFTKPDPLLEEIGALEAEVFVEPTGQNGFAPTDLEFADDGTLYVSMGGRGTTGAIFRIRVINPKEPAANIPFAKGAAPRRASNDLLSELRAIDPDLEGFSATAANAIALRLDAAMLEEPSEVRMLLLRLLMRALGDWNLDRPSAEAFTGYELSSAQVFDKANAELLEISRATPRELLHSLDAEERREAARMVAMLRDPHPITTQRLLAAIDSESSPAEDFHYLACLACAGSPIDVEATRRVAAAIFALDGKFRGRQLRSKQTFTDRLNEVIAKLAARCSLYETLIEDPAFALPNHAGLAMGFPEELRVKAADQFLLAISENTGAGWGEVAVGLLEHATSEIVPGVLRQLYASPMLADRCVLLLARRPEEIDRQRYLAALSSPRSDVSAAALEALALLAPRADAENLVALFRAKDAKRSLSLIARAAGEVFDDRMAAEKWLQSERPEIATAVGLGTVLDDVDWPSLLASVDWASGDPGKGAALFASRACAACHTSASALGPDLAGATQRMSVSDLFKAIAEPNANVSPAYRASVFTMRDGRKVIGKVAFTSADGCIVSISPGSSVRLESADIVEQSEWTKSLMPEGLLSDLGRQDLADLYAYLRSL
jgi:putative heme-binding domain-containing protein